MTKPGRYRWKQIKRMARKGPVDAFRRWCRRNARLKKLTELDAPEAILADARTLAHDAAAAVRLASPNKSEAEALADPTSDLLLHIASECDMTPTEARDHLVGIAEHMRTGMEARGWPMPRHRAACMELVKAIQLGRV